MAFRRRRRRPRVAWFPPIGTQFTIGDDTFDIGPVTFEVDVLANGNTNTTELPLTFDFGLEEIQGFLNQNVPSVTLSDVQGSGWNLKRCVGAVHATYSPITIIDNVISGENTAPPAAFFGCGLMVRKVQGLSSNTSSNVTVFDQDDYTDPWIWRRAWVLGQDASWTVERQLTQSAIGVIHGNRAVGPNSFSGQIAYANFPKCTSGYSNAKESGYMDAKTNRIIGPDERLILTFTSKALPIQPQANYTVDGKIHGIFDFRLLGMLRRFTNRRHASR